MVERPITLNFSEDNRFKAGWQYKDWEL